MYMRKISETSALEGSNCELVFFSGMHSDRCSAGSPRSDAEKVQGCAGRQRGDEGVLVVEPPNDSQKLCQVMVNI